MELRHLRYFQAVAEECHFGRAAERLHIAQPPLSQQIKQLETELGLQLLTRSTRKVELTPAGERYLERVRDILQLVGAANGEAQRIAAGEMGRVTVGFTGSATYEFLPMVARAIRTALPGIELSLRGEMLTPDQVDGLEGNIIDIAFLRPPVSSDELSVTTVRAEPLMCALPETHALANGAEVDLRRLSDEAFIGYPSRHRSVIYDATRAACAAAGFVPTQMLEVRETSTLVSFVAAGMGVALVPASVRHLRITGASIKPLAGRAHNVELAIAARRDERDPAILRALECVHRSVRSIDMPIESIL